MLKVPYNDLSRIHDFSEFAAGFEEIVAANNFIRDVQFAGEFATYVGSRYCLSVANGTDALTISLMALELPPKSIVAVPALTYAATAMAVINAGHIPQFIDIDLQTGLMDLDLLDTDQIQAIIPVHLFGQCLDLSSVSQQIIIVEDCAQAHGARIDNQHVGTHGSFGCFSFYPGKNLGAMGDAGCIITDDGTYFKKIQRIARLGSDPTQKYYNYRQGFNSRMDRLQGLVLSKKLKHLNEYNAERKKIGQRYDNSIGNLVRSRAGTDVYHAYPILVKDRATAIRALEARGIQTLVHYPYPLNQMPVFSKYDCGQNPKASYFSKHCLSIPIFPYMTDTEIDHVINEVSKIPKL